MDSPSTEMWKSYVFRGHRVTVIQQWRDPFGRNMVTVELVRDGEALSEGMLESAFLKDALPAP